jgi:hypothetical protein
MKRTVLLMLGIAAVSATMFAQGGQPPAAAPTDPALEGALAAAPRQLKDGATVIKWKSDYTYDTVRKGTNRLVCFESSGMPGQQPFSSECTSIANLDRVAQNLKFEAEPDREKRKAMIDAAEKNGTRAKPEFGSVWYHVRGPNREQARPHTTVAVPGATAASMGLPDNNKQGGVWIMDAGTSTAHLMIPGS